MREDVVSYTKDQKYEKPEWLEGRLEWFRSLKFGIIVHWGPYAQWDCCESWTLVPDCEWSRRDEIKCWVERDRDLARYQADYWALPGTFNPTLFDADAWASAFVAAGAKYVCFTTKHHDGFCMWDTATTDYKITGSVCPFGRDVTQELFDACRRAGLAISVYFSKPDWHCEHYWDPALNPVSQTANTVGNPDKWEKFVAFTHEQIRELLTNYGPVDILWLDGGWVRGAEDIRMAELVAMARALQPGLIVANRAVGDEFEDFVTPEREIPDEALPSTWEACLPLCPDWKYVEGQTPKSAETVAEEIRYANDRGGNFLLGIGPMADGRIDPAHVAILEKIGQILVDSRG